jgi:MFS family permease
VTSAATTVGRTVSLPRLSRGAGFWAIAASFLALSAFSTAPSSLYGIYGREDHLSSLTITIVYAVYAVGVVVSLLVAGHVSDWYGRRTVLGPALAMAVVAAIVFLSLRSLAGLLVARVLTGLAVGAAVATATAFIADLGSRPGAPATKRAETVATVANVGGLALGPLIAGLLARYASHAVTLTFAGFLAALLAAVVLVVLAPEGHAPVWPRPRYHPQRLAAPEHGRRQFAAATVGAFTAFSVGGLFAGLTGTLLAGPLNHPSPALIGLTVFLTFGTGALVQVATTNWPAHRLVAAGIPPVLTGVGLLVLSGWVSPPSLTLFMVSAVVAGAGLGAVIRGSLAVAIATSGPDDRAGALATFFVAGYAGVSLPVVGAGIALEHLSPRVTVSIFGAAVALAIIAAAPFLVRHCTTPQPKEHHMALSDDLARLSTRAKEAEDHVAAAKAKAKDDVKQDVGTARASAEAEADKLRKRADSDDAKLSAWWKDVQQSWSRHSDDVHSHFEEMKSGMDRNRAERHAEHAYDDAQFAIDFAYSAITEAEYAVLDASLARMEADELATA